MCLTIPARLVEYLDDARQVGTVELGGALRRVNTSLLLGADTAEPGDHVLVHLGWAVSRVSEEEAEQTMELLRLMDGLFDDVDAGDGTPAVAPGAVPLGFLPDRG